MSVVVLRVPTELGRVFGASLVAGVVPVEPPALLELSPLLVVVSVTRGLRSPREIRSHIVPIYRVCPNRTAPCPPRLWRLTSQWILGTSR